MPPRSVKNPAFGCDLQGANVRKPAGELADYLDAENTGSDLSEPDRDSQARALVLKWLLPTRQRRRMVKKLRVTVARLDEALAALPRGKRGRPRDIKAREFIETLKYVYVEETGNEPRRPARPDGTNSEGPFLDFVDAVYRHLVPPRHRKTKEALAQIINRHILPKTKRAEPSAGF